MVIPLLIPLLAQGLAGAGMSAGANLYSQAQQRDVYRNQIRGLERAERDWYANVGSKTGRTIRYPEQSYPGQIYSLQKGIAQSYASGVQTTGQFLRSASMYGGIYGKSSGLYGSGSYSSHRWL